MGTAEASELLSSMQERLSVRLTLPPLSFLKFPPADLPITLPPPPDHPALAHPFTIRADWYNGLLSANVPITIALVYASVVTFLNSVNVRRKYKPWPFSQTTLFKLMVVIHNIFLSLYSLWTFVGMCNALQLSFVSPRNEYGWAATADSLCKIHGPRGLGSSATFNETTTAWTITNRAFHLGADGLTPDSTDVGRIWNEGLAFYGWLFYISKFYEVIDTLIILAKGKKSSLLQTYHHAGAMMGMWAGIRYMSPPIWMFVLVNSFIHFIMYAFYLCSAIGVKVPVWFKRTLTTMQITQFVVGASYAFAHLFVKYQSPLTVSYLHNLGNVVSSMPADVSSVASVAVAGASAETASWLKKLALRAAGREGLAENVFNERGEPFGIDAIHAVQILAKREEMRFRKEVQWVNCLDTSGQTFAILLNCIYLAPLTWLFAQFFIKSYLQAVERRRRSSVSERAYIAGQSGKVAIRSVGRRLSEAFEDSQAGVEDPDNDLVIVDGDEVRREMADALEKAKAGAETVFDKVTEQGTGAVSEAREELDNLTKDVDSQDKEDKGSEEVNMQQERERVAEALDELAQRIKPEAANEEVATEKVEESKEVDTQHSHQGANEVAETFQAEKDGSEGALVDVEAEKDDVTQAKGEGTNEVDDAQGDEETSADDIKEGKEEELNEHDHSQAPIKAYEDDATEIKEEETRESDDRQPVEEVDATADAGTKEEEVTGPEAAPEEAEPAPTEAESAFEEPEPATEAEPAPAEPEPATEAEPAFGEPEPATEAEPAPAEPEPATEAEPAPTEAEPAPTEAEPAEAEPEPAPTEAEPAPTEAEPAPEPEEAKESEEVEEPEETKEPEDAPLAEEADTAADAVPKEEDSNKPEDSQPAEEADTTADVEIKGKDAKESEEAQQAVDGDEANHVEAKEEEVKESDDSQPTADSDKVNDADAREEDIEKHEDAQPAEETSKDNDAEAEKQGKVEDKTADDKPEQHDQPESDADAVKQLASEAEPETIKNDEKEDMSKADDPQKSTEQRPEENAAEQLSKEAEENSTEPQKQKDGSVEEANGQEVATEATADSDADKPTVNGDQHQDSSTEISAAEAQKKDPARSDEVAEEGQKEDVKLASKDEESQDKADGA